MKLRVLPATVLAVALAGCGSVHPGAAAVVDETVISRDDADEAAAAYCSISLLQAEQQGLTEIPNGQVRRQALLDLVRGVVARDLAAEQGLDLSPNTYELSRSERAELSELFGDEAPQIASVLEQSRRTYQIAARLGQDELGGASGEEDPGAAQQAGLEVLTAAISERDVEIDPRYGIDAAGEAVADSGSLSVAAEPVTDETAESLPQTQRCSAGA